MSSIYTKFYFNRDSPKAPTRPDAGSDVHTKKRPPSKWQNHSIVLSRYIENNITWLDTLDPEFPLDHVFIYNKNNDNYKSNKFTNNIILENIGKCDHTYLTHVIRNYANLSEYTLFLTPIYDKHIPESERPNFNTTLDLFGLCDDTLGLIDQETYYSPGCRLMDFMCSDYRLSSYSSVPLKPNKDNITFGQWMLKYVEPDLEKYVRQIGFQFNLGGTFCVSKKNILSRPLDFYTKLIEQFEHYNDSEMAHFFERAWFYIFNIHKAQPAALDLTNT